MIKFSICSDFGHFTMIGEALQLGILKILRALKNCLKNYDVLIISILPNYRLVAFKFAHFPENHY